jgi:hypothetical protein
MQHTITWLGNFVIYMSTTRYVLIN